MQNIRLRGGFNKPQKGKSVSKDKDDEGQEANSAVFRDIARRYLHVVALSCVYLQIHVRELSSPTFFGAERAEKSSFKKKNYDASKEHVTLDSSLENSSTSMSEEAHIPQKVLFADPQCDCMIVKVTFMPHSTPWRVADISLKMCMHRCRQLRRKLLKERSWTHLLRVPTVPHMKSVFELFLQAARFSKQVRVSCAHTASTTCRAT